MEAIDYTYRFRLYPTVEQELKLSKHFGCVRWIYNYFLDNRIRFYKDAKEKNSIKKTLNYNDDSRLLTELKQRTETKWLNEINSQSLQQSLQNLDSGFTRFFKKTSKFPKFKSKKDKQSFKIPQNVKVKNGRLHVFKFKEGIKVSLHRPIEGKVRNATISKNKADEYFVCINVQRCIKQLPKSENQVGIDLGIKTLATCSDGVTFPNIKPYKTLEKKRRVLAKGLSRTIKGSKGREKARLKLAKLDNYICNIRQDHLHKISHQIVSENQTIVMEDLNVRGMLKNRKLSKSIWDCSFSELIRQIKYKASWYGREFLQVSQWFASSKTCNNCNYINESLTLADLEWTCLNCETAHNRDLNAAKNILKQGLEIQKTVGITGLAVCPDVRLLAKEAVGWNGNFKRMIHGKYQRI